MQISGSVTGQLVPSQNASTGHTATQSVYLHLMHGSATMYVMDHLRGLSYSIDLTANPKAPPDRTEQSARNTSREAHLGVLPAWSESPAMEPGEGLMGNVGYLFVLDLDTEHSFLDTLAIRNL